MDGRNSASNASSLNKTTSASTSVNQRQTAAAAAAAAAMGFHAKSLSRWSQRGFAEKPKYNQTFLCTHRGSREFTETLLNKGFTTIAGNEISKKLMLSGTEKRRNLRYGVRLHRQEVNSICGWQSQTAGMHCIAGFQAFNISRFQCASQR